MGASRTKELIAAFQLVEKRRRRRRRRSAAQKQG
jgi:hypothetical protein